MGQKQADRQDYGSILMFFANLNPLSIILVWLGTNRNTLTQILPRMMHCNADIALQ